MKIIEELKTKPAPVYLVCGDETFLKEEFFKEVKSLLRMADFNYDVFYCGAHTADEIISRLVSYPVGDDFRVVAAMDAHKLSSQEQKKILGYIDKPSETSMFFMEVESVPAGAFFKTVAAKGKKLLFAVKSEREIGPWLQERALRLGKKLSKDAAAGLKELGGKNLHMLSNELEKLSLQVGEKEEITIEALDFSAGWNRVRTGFELGGAISEGNQKFALRVLSDIFAGGNVFPEMILGSLAWQFRALWKVNLAVRKGMRGGKLAASCGIPPFRVNEFMNQARKYSDLKLEGIFEEILQTDLKMKTKENPQFQLEIMIVKLCRIVAA